MPHKERQEKNMRLECQVQRTTTRMWYNCGNGLNGEKREKSHLGNCAERDEMALRYFKRFENWRMSEEIEDKYLFSWREE